MAKHCMSIYVPNWSCYRRMENQSSKYTGAREGFMKDSGTASWILVSVIISGAPITFELQFLLGRLSTWVFLGFIEEQDGPVDILGTYDCVG